MSNPTSEVHHHAHPISHFASILFEINNPSSSCVHAFWFSLKISERGHEGPTYQLATYPL